MTLTQLNYAVALATHRHFGRAAEACHVSQPTLSMQIQKLEDELGVTLFDRSYQPVQPTEVGERVIQQARIVLAERDRIPALVSEVAHRLEGELRLGIIPTLVPYLMPLVAGPFGERYPRIDLVVREMTTQPLLAALGEDELDAGLIATEETYHGLESRPLFREPFVAYVSPDHRFASKRLVDSSDLSLDDLWLLKEGHCFRDQVLQVCGQESQACGAMRSILFESGSLETLRNTVDSVGGMTLLPYLATLYLSDEQMEEHVKPFRSPIPRREISIVYRREYLKKHLIDAYVDVVLEELPPELLEAA